MRRRRFSRIAILSILAVAIAATATLAAPAQDSESPTKAAPAAKADEFRGRLPAYYSGVVDEKQRKAIYDIQEEYAPQIAALQAQLKALLQERNEKVATVLTPEQLQKVEAARATAAAKRAQKAPPKAPPKKTAAATASAAEPRP